MDFHCAQMDGHICKNMHLCMFYTYIIESYLFEASAISHGLDQLERLCVHPDTQGFVAYVGEWCSGMTATMKFHESLLSKFELLDLFACFFFSARLPQRYSQ